MSAFPPGVLPHGNTFPHTHRPPPAPPPLLLSSVVVICGTAAGRRGRCRSRECRLELLLERQPSDEAVGRCGGEQATFDQLLDHGGLAPAIFGPAAAAATVAVRHRAGCRGLSAPAQLPQQLQHFGSIIRAAVRGHQPGAHERSVADDQGVEAVVGVGEC